MRKTIHKFYSGDATSIIKTIKKESIQLIVTSPPYWNAKDYNNKKQLGYYDSYSDYIKKLKIILNSFQKILLPDGKIAINIGNIYQKDLIEKRHFTINLILEIWNILYKNKNLRFMGTIYWKKTTSRNGAVLFGSYPYPSNFMISTGLEAIHIFRKIGKREIAKSIKEKSKVSKTEFRKLREPIWTLNGISKKDHPAVFPFELVSRLIKMYSFNEDIILDPFCGIGTSNMAARKLNRNSIGIDINIKYIKKCLKSFDNNCDIYFNNKTIKKI